MHGEEHCGQVRSDDFGGLTLGPRQNLDFALEVLARGELNSLRLRDTDLLESFGINTFTGLSLDYFEGSKPY